MLSRGALAGAAEPAAAGKEVTLIGLALNNSHLYEKQKYVFCLAYDGTPEIKAEFEKILAEYFPDKGLDADAARQAAGPVHDPPEIRGGWAALRGAAQGCHV